jgi:cysteinyl-tRNA synthetase
MIKVLNSLSGKKEELEFNGRKDIYAPSHMGHARNYVTFDIIRRILTSLFRRKFNRH